MRIYNYFIEYNDCCHLVMVIKKNPPKIVGFTKQLSTIEACFITEKQNVIWLIVCSDAQP